MHRYSDEGRKASASLAVAKVDVNCETAAICVFRLFIPPSQLFVFFPNLHFLAQILPKTTEIPHNSDKKCTFASLYGE